MDNDGVSGGCGVLLFTIHSPTTFTVGSSLRGLLLPLLFAIL
jgi:hypothetical protein